jgi:NAD(P)-dependent dehydrogenase (short-subunit alcohol dehydrogenase family)
MATAIVTGGSRGLGRALVAALAGRGWRVVTTARTAAELERAWPPDGAHAGEVVAIAGDLTDEAHRRRIVETASERGDLALLVNNAGTLGPTPLPTLATASAEALDETLHDNAVVPLALVQLALPALRAAGGTVVNVTSDAAVEGYEGWGVYGAAKAALEQLSRVLAAEEPEVRVLVVDPGDMRTRMQQQAFPGEDISDRPPPEESVPGFLALIEGTRPSGRYAAREAGAPAR